MDCRDTPGLVVSVVREGETFSRAYGKADVRNNISTSTDSIFCLASLTKAFTATLLAGLLPAEFPESRCAPAPFGTLGEDILGEEFHFVDDVRTELTTVKDLLSHRTGLIRGDLGIYGGYPETVTRREMVHRLNHLEARFGFRDKLLYNNWMYMLAGYIAEVLSGGESWEDLIVKNILGPLGMDSTVFLRDLRRYVNTTLAVPYRVVNGDFHPFPLEHYSFHPEQPAASICSTGNDMIKWMQFLLNIKSFGMTPTNLANTSAFQDTMTPHMVMETWFGFDPPLPGNPHSYGFGFGWVIGSYRGHRLVNHAGALLASSSVLWLLPDQKTGIFVAANRQARDPVLALIAYYLADVTSGETPWLNHTTSCTFPEPWREVQPTVDFPSKAHAPQRPLEEYTGTYGNKLFGDFRVFIRHAQSRGWKLNTGNISKGFCCRLKPKTHSRWP
ncbi:uncharacterized protein LOC135473503 [Liolophura sinensis]|uniref:uncharacterized protein LOC135473503 n=1 Tax=Liolophura sinensis TaxID=3198878 RepID=UPI003157F87C